MPARGLWRRGLLGLLIALSGAGTAAAAEAAGEQTPPPAAAVDEGETLPLLDALDAPHATLSQGVETLASAIDRFFANTNDYNYSNESYAQLRLDSYWQKAHGVDFQPGLRGKLHLPFAERRFRLMLETEPAELLAPNERQQNIPAPTAVGEEGDYFLSLLWARAGKGWQVRPAVGAVLKVHGELFARLNLYRSFLIHPGYSVRPAQTFYWYSERGKGSDTSLEFNVRVGERHLFRATTLLRWTKRKEYWEPSETLTLYRRLSPRARLYYQLGVYAQAEPVVHAVRYTASINYRRQIHRDWLFYEVRPQLSYEEVDDWRPTPSILLRLDAVFGRRRGL